MDECFWGRRDSSGRDGRRPLRCDARARGAEVIRFGPEDLDELEAQLRSGDWRRPGLICIDRGIYVTMAVYPLVPRDEVGFRLQLTAATTDEQVDHLCEVLGDVAERFQLTAQGTG